MRVTYKGVCTSPPTVHTQKALPSRAEDFHVATWMDPSLCTSSSHRPHARLPGARGQLGTQRDSCTTPCVSMQGINHPPTSPDCCNSPRWQVRGLEETATHDAERQPIPTQEVLEDA